MAEQAGKKPHHGTGHAGHFDQQAEKHKQRHGQQDQMRHALVHPANQRHRGHAGGQGEIAECGEREGKHDGHAGKHAKTDDSDEKNHQIEIAKGFQARPQPPKGGNNAGHKCDGEEGVGRSGAGGEAQHRKRHHQGDAAGERRRPPCGGNFQRRCRDNGLVAGPADSRSDDQHQKAQPSRQRQRIEKAAPRETGPRHQRRHAHVLVAAQGDCRPQHRQPEEQRRGQFIRPGDRPVQHIAGENAGKQRHDFGDQQDCCGNFDTMAQHAINARRMALP